MSQADIRRGDWQWEHTPERIREMQRSAYYIGIYRTLLSAFATSPARDSDSDDLDIAVRWTKKP